MEGESVSSVLSWPVPCRARGVTAKTPGRHGIAKCSQASFPNSQDGRHQQGRRAPHHLRQLLPGDGRSPHRTAGDGRGRRKTAEYIGKQRKTAGTTEDDRGRRRTIGDGGGRHNVIHPSPWLLLVGQVQEKAGRDDEMSSILVLVQDGRTAPLRSLIEIAPYR